MVLSARYLTYSGKHLHSLFIFSTSRLTQKNCHAYKKNINFFSNTTLGIRCLTISVHSKENVTIIQTHLNLVASTMKSTIISYTNLCFITSLETPPPISLFYFYLFYLILALFFHFSPSFFSSHLSSSSPFSSCLHICLTVVWQDS